MTDTALLGPDETFKAEKHFTELECGHKRNQLEAMANSTVQYTIIDNNRPPQFLLENVLLAPAIPTSLFSVHSLELARCAILATEHMETINHLCHPVKPYIKFMIAGPKPMGI